MAQDGQVVDGDDEWYRRAARCALRGTVEHINAVGRCTLGEPRIPVHIAAELRAPRSSRSCVLDKLESWVAAKSLDESPDMSRGTGLCELEGRDVNTHT